MSARRPLLVLLHGAAGTHAAWQPQVEGLLDTADVVTPDLPGHGTRRRERFSFAAASAAVANVIRRSDQDVAVVAGLSLGGYVAMDVASRQPGLVSGLALSGCTIDYSRPRMRWLVAANRLAIGLYPRRVLDLVQSRTLRAQYPRWADQMLADGFHWGGFAQALAPLSRSYFPDRLSRFDGPIVLIAGENDRRNRREEPRFLAALPRAERVVLPGAGHLCNLDDPEGFNAALRALLDR